MRTLIFDRVSIGGFDACWWWKGNENVHGYGTIKIKSKTHLAHRLVYEWLRGAIPKGKLLHHTCEDPLCVNPKHLVPLTRGEHHEAHDFKGNRAIAAKMRARTHCPHGHPFDDANTYWTPAGHRKCRVCDRERKRT